jgi:hypothetical protein
MGKIRNRGERAEPFLSEDACGLLMQLVSRPRNSRPRNSNRVFETYNEIIDAACEAWRNLIALPQTITSIGMREWAHNGQS